MRSPSRVASHILRPAGERGCPVSFIIHLLLDNEFEAPFE